jgi:hypothetical protein
MVNGQTLSLLHNHLNTTNMKTFTLSIFKGHELKQQKEVTVNSLEELKAQRNGFWSESPYKNVGKNWMGTKRIR